MAMLPFYRFNGYRFSASEDEAPVKAPTVHGAVRSAHE
jgi:prophage maintenance system killer protein